MSLHQYSNLILRFGVFVIFFYFGLMAVLNPELEAAKWIKKDIYDFINSILPIAIFMTAFGTFQIAVALAILFKVLYRWVLLAAGGMLVGIMVNLGFNDVSLRDFVIFTAVTHLYLSRRQ